VSRRQARIARKARQGARGYAVKGWRSAALEVGGIGKDSPTTHSTGSPGPFDKLRASSPGTGRAGRLRTGWQQAVKRYPVCRMLAAS